MQVDVMRYTYVYYIYIAFYKYKVSTRDGEITESFPRQFMHSDHKLWQCLDYIILCKMKKWNIMLNKISVWGVSDLIWCGRMSDSHNLINLS